MSAERTEAKLSLYEQYRNLDADLSQIALAPHDGREGYFCTPLGAGIIGWAGVDGIHACFAHGTEGPVLAVNPAGAPGENVHVLAEDFEDFLRVVLACGFDAAEQAWMMSRSEFDSCCEACRPTDAQRAVLDAIADRLRLTPMEDPYGYIRDLQSRFDYGSLSYAEEYQELLDGLGGADGMEPSAWKVRLEGREMEDARLVGGAAFHGLGADWQVLGAYACDGGYVVDMCVPLEAPKWILSGAFLPFLLVDGESLDSWSGVGMDWDPAEPSVEAAASEAAAMVRHYGLDPEKGWFFFRNSYPAASGHEAVPDSLRLTLEPAPCWVPGMRFVVRDVGDKVPFAYPATGLAHVLRVIRLDEPDPAILEAMREGAGLPSSIHCVTLAYVVEPPLPEADAMRVWDSSSGDMARPERDDSSFSAVCEMGIVQGADGPTAVFLADRDEGPERTAMSSLYQEPPERIVWQMAFREFGESVEVDLRPDRER